MPISLSTDCGLTTDRRRAEARARRLAKRVETLADEGRVEEAIVCQVEVASLLPDDPSAFTRLGRLYREAHCLEPALSAFRHASGLNPRHRDSREALLETLLEADRFPEAIAEGKALAKMEPRNLFAREALCIVYLQTGQINKAVQMTNEMIWLDPDNPGHHFKRGLLLQQQGHSAAAIESLMRAKQSASRESELYADAHSVLAEIEDDQLRKILVLAIEDRVFALNLQWSMAESLEARGFALGDGGLSRLRHMLADREGYVLEDGTGASTALRLYN